MERSQALDSVQTGLESSSATYQVGYPNVT